MLHWKWSFLMGMLRSEVRAGRERMWRPSWNAGCVMWDHIRRWMDLYVFESEHTQEPSRTSVSLLLAVTLEKVCELTGRHWVTEIGVIWNYWEWHVWFMSVDKKSQKFQSVRHPQLEFYIWKKNPSSLLNASSNRGWEIFILGSLLQCEINVWDDTHNNNLKS